MLMTDFCSLDFLQCLGFGNGELVEVKRKGGMAGEGSISEIMLDRLYE